MRLLSPALLLLVGAACSEVGLAPNDDPVDEVPDDTAAPDTDVDTDTPEDTAPDDTSPDDTAPVADQPVYAHDATTLYSIDPATGAAQRIGDFVGTNQTIDSMVDIAIDSAGRLYGGTWAGLWRIDPTTAEATFLCSTTASMTGMTFSSDDELFAGSGGVYRVNTGTCDMTPVTILGSFTTSGDLVGLPDGFLYWTVIGSGNDDLVKLDPNTGATTLVGTTGAVGLWGVAYDDGQLYGFSSSGGVYRIDPTTAASTLLSTPTSAWWGATTNPVVWP